MTSFNRIVIRFILIATLFLCGTLGAQAQQSSPTPFGGIQTNESTINGLRDGATELRDSIAVFRRLFAGFSDTVVIYPSENYYYFGFTAAGRTIMGSVSLFPHERDSGRIGFGYTEKRDRDRWNEKDLVGGWGTFGAAEGVMVERIDAMRCRVTCDGRGVVFRFHDLPTNAPPSGFLRSDERFVLRNLDESGVGFLLLFNMTMKRFYWVLDPEQPETETYRLLTSTIAVGERTEFAFHVDTIGRRLVLIGVQGHNVLNNNWYDGPFDQLPDNQIESGVFELQSYIEQAMPQMTGRVDRYGHYMDNPATRVAIAPYLVYYSDQDLIDIVAACDAEGVGSSPYLTCITQQIFRVPDQVAAK